MNHSVSLKSHHGTTLESLSGEREGIIEPFL